MTLPNWTPPLTKLRVYEAFYLLNRSFEATIHAVDQLHRLEFFQNAELPVLQNRLEELRSETNEILIENMQEYEHDEAFRFGELVREWEKSKRDPNELYFRSQEYKEELREQIQELQEALDRQDPKPPSSRPKPSRRKTSRRKASKRKTPTTEE